MAGNIIGWGVWVVTLFGVWALGKGNVVHQHHKLYIAALILLALIVVAGTFFRPQDTP